MSAHSIGLLWLAVEPHSTTFLLYVWFMVLVVGLLLILFVHLLSSLLATTSGQD